MSASASCCVCVRILLFVCPHTSIQRIRPHRCFRFRCILLPHTPACVRILLHMCSEKPIEEANHVAMPHTAAANCFMCPHPPYMCHHAAIFMCTHTPSHVYAYAYVCVLMRGCIAVLVRRSLFKTMGGEMETAYFLGTFHTRDVKV